MHPRFLQLKTPLLLAASLAALSGCGGQQVAAGASPSPGAARTLKQSAGTQSTVQSVRVDLRAGWNGVGFQSTQVTSLDAPAAVSGLAFFNGTNYTTGSLNAATINADAGGRRGFWVFASAPASFTYSGSGGPDFVDLQAGWNLVSFATSAPLPGSSLRASRNGASVPLDQAVLTAFTEIQPDNSYRTVDVANGGTLEPGRACWVFAGSPTRLSVELPTPSPVPSPVSGQFTVLPANPSVQVFAYVQLNALAGGQPVPVTWTSSAPSVAAVDSQGLVRGLNPGQATVQARDAGGGTSQTLVTVTDTAPPVPLPSPSTALFVPSLISRADGLQGAPVAPTDTVGTPPASLPRQLSDDGRYAVVLASGAGLPAAGVQAYRREVTTGAMTLASSHNGIAAPLVRDASISPDGRYIAFTAYTDPSSFGGAFSGGGTFKATVYLRDMNGPTLRLVSCAAGLPTTRSNSSGPPDTAIAASVSGVSGPSGPFVAYTYTGISPNAVTGPLAPPTITDGRQHVYLSDMGPATPVTRILSVAPTGATGLLEGNADSSNPSLSSDGRFLAFQSNATNLVPGSTTSGSEIYRADATAVQADVRMVSMRAGVVAPSGAVGTQNGPSISADGRYVAFVTDDTSAITGTAGTVPTQIVRVDASAVVPRPVVLVSADSGGDLADGACSQPWLAGDGSVASFTTLATDLVPGAAFRQVVRRRLGANTTTLISRLNNTPGDGDSTYGCITPDGQHATFFTRADNLGFTSPILLRLAYLFLGP